MSEHSRDEKRERDRIEERFVRYAKVDTASDHDSPSIPSTAKQLNLQRMLKDELRDLGAEDVQLTDYGCVLATLPSTVENEVPTVALLAHVDTSPDFSGEGVEPLIIRDYDGSPIPLPDAPERVLNEETAPELAEMIGETIISASGTTLLGADDKAGVAIIMTLAERLLTDRTTPHGRLRICFTPDEEVGRGVENLTLEDLDADVAYTLDGEARGEVTYESFSADEAVVTIEGVSIHPGKAKDRLVNALTLAGKLINALPQHAYTPETSAGREGFIHLSNVEGNANRVELRFILRAFELDELDGYGEFLKTLVDALAQSEPRARFEVRTRAQYRNMRYWLENDMRPADLAVEAIRRAGMTPEITPIRGGTDGSQLTERGLPTPNLFAGTHNAHGPLEWVSLEDMVKGVDVCEQLVRLWAEQDRDVPSPAQA